jgi:hypothetical protein
VNDTSKEQSLGGVTDTSGASSPIVIFPPMSDRMIAEANKMFQEVFSNPRAKKRKPSHPQKRRTRAKQKKNVASS